MSTRFAALLLAIAAMPAAGQPSVSVSFGTHAGEIVEGFPITAVVTAVQPTTSFCRLYEYVRDGRELRIVVRPGYQGCAVPVNIGPLPEGAYTFHARFESSLGVTIAESRGALDVLPLAGRCNLDPELDPAIYGYTASHRDAERLAAIAADATLAARFPGVHATRSSQEPGILFHLPPLQDAPPVMRYLNDTYAWVDLWDGLPDAVYRNGRVCLSAPPPAAVTVIEFRHAAWDTYFYTGDGAEIAALDASPSGAWQRTGASFGASAASGCAPAEEAQAVYRFFGTPGVGPRSHFFTRGREECHAVDRTQHWTYEGVAFWAGVPTADGTCKAASDGTARVPLYRLWRPFGESAHRLTPDRAVVDLMTAQGWVDEGARMCVHPR